MVVAVPFCILGAGHIFFGTIEWFRKDKQIPALTSKT
jgi:hypothetical protein